MPTSSSTPGSCSKPLLAPAKPVHKSFCPLISKTGIPFLRPSRFMHLQPQAAVESMHAREYQGGKQACYILVFLCCTLAEAMLHSVRERLTHGCQAGIWLSIKAGCHHPEPLLGESSAPVLLCIRRRIRKVVLAVSPLNPAARRSTRHQNLLAQCSKFSLHRFALLSLSPRCPVNRTMHVCIAVVMETSPA